MYYDRRIDDELAETLKPGGPLAWLMDHVGSVEGREHHAHLQLRRARSGGRARGSVQLYWGRTSPIEVQLRRGARVRLAANRTYRQGSAGLFERSIPIADLASLRPKLEAHLGRSSRLLRGTSTRRLDFLKGEATCHAGLMWRYGHRWRSGDALVAVDSEARVGYESRSAQTEADGALRSELGLASREALPKKLDAVGVSPTGDLLLVEVKDAEGSIARAAKQVAAHVERFTRLMGDGDLRDTVQAMLEQRREAGLIPAGPDLAKEPQIVPWIAAPDGDPTWPGSWVSVIEQLQKPVRNRLAGLRLVLLSRGGEIHKESSA